VPWMTLVCLVNVWTVDTILGGIRGFQFRSRWRPEFEAFLKEHPPRTTRHGSNQRRGAREQRNT
jgi:hypothetical protein